MKIIENGTVTSPKGYLGAGEHVGIKKAKKDLALIYSKVNVYNFKDLKNYHLE